jgi:hypothetical protein
MEDAKHTVFEALGLDPVNHHGTTFRREKVQDDLFISFKLRKVVERESLKKFFLYTKTSKAG